MTQLINQSERKLKWALDKINEATNKGFKIFGPNGIPLTMQPEGSKSTNGNGRGCFEGLLGPKESIQLAVTFCSGKI